MPSYFERVTVVVPIDTDDLATAQDTVEVRKLNYGERQRAISKATRVKVQGKNQQDIDIDAGLMSMEMLKFAIVRWDGPGFEGQPVTPSNIEALPPEIADKLAEAVDTLNPELSDEEKKA